MPHDHLIGQTAMGADWLPGLLVPPCHVVAIGDKHWANGRFNHKGSPCAKRRFAERHAYDQRLDRELVNVDRHAFDPLWSPAQSSPRVFRSSSNVASCAFLGAVD